MPPRTRYEEEALEETYTFPRVYQRQTVIEYVAANRERLAYDYFEWVSKQAFQEGPLEMVMRFEEETFGRALEPSAHGMLMWAVKWRYDHHGHPVNALFASMSDQDAVEAIAREAHKLDFVDMEAHARYIAIRAGLMSPEAATDSLLKPMSEPTDVQPDWMPYAERDDDDKVVPFAATAAAVSPSREPGEDDGDDWYEDDDA